MQAGDRKDPDDAWLRIPDHHAAAIREATLAGLGIALLPSFIVAGDLRENRLQVVLGGYEVEGAVANDVYALYLPTRYVSPKVRAFVDFFVERFAPNPDAVRA